MNKQIREREEGTSTYTYTHTGGQESVGFLSGSIDRAGCFRSGTREPNTRVNIIWAGKRDFLTWEGGKLDARAMRKTQILSLKVLLH